MNWVYLIIAGFFEICFTTCLKTSDNFTKGIPTFLFFVFSIMSFWFLNKSLSSIPLGIAYAIWTGIGAAGTVLVGIFWFQDHLNTWQLIFLVTLIGSILGLKILS